MPDRLPPALRADLTEFARIRIEQVWADSGPVPAQVLAENIVLAQEFAWMAAQTPIGCPAGCGCITESDPDARECACDGPCTMDPAWPGTASIHKQEES